MNYITKLKLAAIHQLCDAEDRSTEFTIEYMADMCKVDHDTVMEYFMLTPFERTKLFQEVIEFTEMFESIEYDDDDN